MPRPNAIRPYTLAFYERIVRLSERLPTKAVAKIMNCAASTVRSAKHRLKSCNELQRIATR